MTNHSQKENNSSCLFCDIATGQLTTPGIFWEDSDFMAFLAIDPNTEGFSCVIPKKHYDSDVLAMPDEVLCRFMVATKQVAQILKNYYADVGRVGVIMEGMGINHAHLKLIPMHGTGHLKEGKWRSYSSGPAQWFSTYEGWLSSASGPLADPKHLQELASKLRASY
ncbi:MAG: HIT domain protein [Parcubacteria group bacterium ADurb.Bin016]|nr:MAG: HIT domain protein [Parcubacteria group bacterium ADurb.Bin016]HNQ45129.1 HIT family protein [bacterium]